MQRFIARNPGTVVSTAAARNPGFPIWVGVQHFLNLFLLIFIIRSGIQILSDHPRLYGTRHSTPGRDWVAHFSKIGGGYGGYNEDHEFFGYRQTI